MSEILELKIKNPKKICQELTWVLAPHREKPSGSVLFIVEGTKQKPMIGIRYPGRKVRKRTLRVVRANSAQWANLYDFEVVPYYKGKELDTTMFTFNELLDDFQNYKRSSEKFWRIIEELYEKNTIVQKVPSLPGINSLLYLMVLKWIWVQEDFNYRFDWKDVNSPIKYVLETRTGSRTSRGAGRAKFIAALILLKHHFDLEQVKKIVPLY